MNKEKVLELREDNLIDSEPDGRFERFYCLGYLIAKSVTAGKTDGEQKLFEMPETPREHQVIF